MDPKLMAKALRAELDIPHSRALEIVAKQLGYRDWNTAAAQPRFTETCPILRIFDEVKALDFYIGWLGFTQDWQHRFHPGAPLYTQVSRAGLILHLSEHHGDAVPGATTFVRMKNIRAFHAEVMAKPYANMRPGLETEEWGTQMTVYDPFRNTIRFCES